MKSRVFCPRTSTTTSLYSLLPFFLSAATLSPYHSKILAAAARRLLDQDSSVRSACVNSVSTLSRHATKQPFSTFLKPLAEPLFTKQDPDGAPDPDPARLAKLLPKFEKMLKREGFRAKPSLLTLIGSVVHAGGASSHAMLKSLVPCLVESLSGGDWAARKAGAEALVVLANVERVYLSEFKAGCLKVFENRRFDKVKVVREFMNQMLEAWKHIPDVSDEFSFPTSSIAIFFNCITYFFDVAAFKNTSSNLSLATRT